MSLLASSLPSASTYPDPSTVLSAAWMRTGECQPKLFLGLSKPGLQAW